MLTGGLGSDEIYGGPDDDYVVAAPATVGEPGSATDVLGSRPCRSASSPARAAARRSSVGGTGSDRIYGSDGASTIFGDTTVDGCAVQSDPVSKQPPETTVAGDAADLILGGNGVDVVNAGGGDDWVYAAGGADRSAATPATTTSTAATTPTWSTAAPAPTRATARPAPTRSTATTATMRSTAAPAPTGCRATTGPTGSTAAPRPTCCSAAPRRPAPPTAPTRSSVRGGADLLVGDNAQTDVLASAPYPTDLGSTDATLGGNDYLVGGDDDDRVYGGLGNDTAYGGNGDDYTEGNPGTDRDLGRPGDDDLIGGSSELATGLFTGSEPGRPDTDDFLYGGAGQDVIAGDNAPMTRGGTAHPVMAGRGLTTTRGVDLADEGAGRPPAVSGGDTIQGGDDTDVVFGQRGDDDVSLGRRRRLRRGRPGRRPRPR